MGDKMLYFFLFNVDVVRQSIYYIFLFYFLFSLFRIETVFLKYFFSSFLYFVTLLHLNDLKEKNFAVKKREKEREKKSFYV